MLGSPRLRDSHVLVRPYSIGILPKKSLISIARSVSYLVAIGEKDLNGNKWEEIFSHAVSGENLSRPLGLADVVKDSFSWSVKTVKNDKPHEVKKIRIISGRNNVTYSFGIENPLSDIALTGEAVLSIFNERIKTAKSTYKDLTHSILIRSPDLTSFTYFECEANVIDPKEIKWVLNKRGNLEGFKNKEHLYTWQPNGSQFTIIYNVPKSSQKFTVRKPKMLDFNSVIKLIEFDEKWLQIQ